MTIRGLCDRCGNYPTICGCAEAVTLAARLAGALKANDELNAECMKESARTDGVEDRLAKADDKLLSVAIELGTTKARLAEAERLLFALRDGIAVADFGDWNLLDQVDSFRSGDSTASSASGVQK